MPDGVPYAVRATKLNKASFFKGVPSLEKKIAKLNLVRVAWMKFCWKVTKPTNQGSNSYHPGNQSMLLCEWRTAAEIVRSWAASLSIGIQVLFSFSPLKCSFNKLGEVFIIYVPDTVARALPI